MATTFYRLLAVKDEYEVARLHTDAAFREALEAQFEGVAGKDFGIRFNLAPPTLTHPQPGINPAKKPSVNGCGRCSACWRNGAACAARCSIRSAARSNARWSANSPTITKPRCNAFAKLNANNTEDVAKLADLHARVRGYGHVKLANLAGVKRGERDLAARLQIEAATGACVKKSLEEVKGAGQLRGIPVVVAK